MARSRLSTSMATILVLAGAGGLSWLGAEQAASFIEDRATRDVTQALREAGHDWAGVAADGLRVTLTGTAPTEVERFRAVTQAGTAVDPGRIEDRMTVASVEAMAAPEFKVELLRSEQGLSMIGLIPAATDRAAMRRAFGGGTVQDDLLEQADHPVPDGWTEALRFGLQAAGMADQAKITVAPGRVQVTALAADRAAQGQLEQALRRAAPGGVTVDLDISAPRPVIAPYILRFALDADGARFDACSAPDADGRTRIMEAARAAGLETTPDCALGLGAPSDDWPQAAAAAIEALGQLGQGQVTLSDAQVALVVPAAVTRERLDQVAGALDGALPDPYRLEVQREEADVQAAPIEFQATLPPSGELAMRGRIADDQMREVVDSFARSRFAVAQSGLRPDPSVPAGWTVRVIAGLEAMAPLHAGQARVTPDMVELTGVSGDPRATERAAALLSDRLGAGAAYRLAISYDRRLDEALGLPDGEECVARLNIIMSESEIGFEPNSAAIAGDPEPTMARLAQAMTDCDDFLMEAGGHTDSQGSEAFNAELSRSRAQALVTAMTEAGIDTANMSSRGYGESRPVATNQTEEGREINRRIEFRLLSPHPVGADQLPGPVTVTGVTGDTPPPAPVPAGTLADDTAQGPQLPPVQGPVLPVVAPQMQGPQLPLPTVATGTAPMTLGVTEEFQTLDEREENLRVPVLTPDDDTPRPGPRPDSVAQRAGGQDEATDE